jgi:glutamate 5-kinase
MRSRRLVVKIGSSSLTDSTAGGLSRAAIDAFASMSHAARAADIDLVLVTSGAIASGFRAIGYSKKPTVVRMKQAAAAVGQGLLMQAYSESFSRFGAVVAQVLLTRAELSHRVAFDNAFQTLDELISNDVIPIINENDSIATDELKFGDNDILSAYVA